VWALTDFSDAHTSKRTACAVCLADITDHFHAPETCASNQKSRRIAALESELAELRRLGREVVEQRTAWVDASGSTTAFMGAVDHLAAALEAKTDG